jgi:hypothetical protein
MCVYPLNNYYSQSRFLYEIIRSLTYTNRVGNESREETQLDRKPKRKAIHHLTPTTNIFFKKIIQYFKSNMCTIAINIIIGVLIVPLNN